jgi:hypothetical protein
MPLSNRVQLVLGVKVMLSMETRGEEAFCSKHSWKINVVPFLSEMLQGDIATCLLWWGERLGPGSVRLARVTIR